MIWTIDSFHKNKYYHIVGTVPKSQRKKIIVRGNIDTPDMFDLPFDIL